MPSIKNPYSRLNIALISDSLTYGGLRRTCNVSRVTPLNARIIFTLCKPDILLVESCWLGYANAWKYGVASYTDYPNRTNKKLKKVVSLAKEAGIPTVFWNKEDGVHFERFIESASLFDHVFTTDANMIAAYRQRIPDVKTVEALPFAVNPALHYPGDAPPTKPFCFVGSYRKDLHENRRHRQELLFSAAQPYGLDIYDRNSDRKSAMFRFPDAYARHVNPRVSYEKTGDIYRTYAGCLNINTVLDSPTMFSRRVVEVMACKSPLISTPSLSMETLFEGCAFIADDEASAREHCSRIIKDGDAYKAAIVNEAYERVMREYSYNGWLNRIVDAVL